MTALAARFEAEVFVVCAGQRVSALSLMGLLVLTAHRGTEIELQASGKEADQVLEALETLIDDRFYEEA